mgnify:FL=1
MSFFSIKPSSGFWATPSSGGLLRTAFSKWLLTNHGATYRQTIKEQQSRENATNFQTNIEQATALSATDTPLVGIVGGGFAGLYAGIILQSLGIEWK